MKRKVIKGFDNFKLDDGTRKEALDNILAMVSSNAADGAGSKEDASGAVRSKKKEATMMKLNKGRRFGAVAAGILGGILLLGGAAYAAGWIGLKDLAGESTAIDMTWAVTEEAQTARDSRESGAAAPETGSMTYNYMNVSLAGIKGSPEYEAWMEWDAFCRPYFFAHENEVPNDERPIETYYDVYGCWDQKTKDRLDDVLTKYGLQPHHTLTGIGSLDDLCEKTGIARIFPTLNERTGRHAGSPDYWYYDDGSFSIERMTDWQDTENAFAFRMDRCVKGVLNEVTLNIDDPSHYEEWDYTTAAGIHVSAIEATEEFLSKNGTLIDPSVIFIIDRPESFVSIHIIFENIPYPDGGRSHEYKVLPREELEAFLESICLENIP